MKLSTLALIALAVTPNALAFTPIAFNARTGVATSPSSSSLHASVVSKFLTKEEAETAVVEKFEKETPESVGLKDESAIQKETKKNKKRRRKHNFAERSKELSSKKPDTDFYTLNSSNVSHLTKETTVEDVITAIKRARNLHDGHDLAVIAAFLIDECDDKWGYGFRGSLLSRLVVAALHSKEIDVARKAIQCRRVYERPSIQPHESAAIVRGLMRQQLVDEAWLVLEDELRLPLDGIPLTTEHSKELLRHRAHVLCSIATRHFYDEKPNVAIATLSKLTNISPYLKKANMTNEEMNLPWDRLMKAAKSLNNNYEQQVVNTMMGFEQK